MGIFSRKVIHPETPEAEASMSMALGRPVRRFPDLTVLWPGFAVRSEDPSTVLIYDAGLDIFRPLTLRDVVLLHETVKALAQKHGVPLLTPEELAERDAAIDPERRLNHLRLDISARKD